MKKTSPIFAYETVYGKLPDDNRRGRPPFKIKTKIWKGMEVDYDLKNEWLENINNIPNIEIRATCAGHKNNWVSFIMFRIIDPLKIKKIKNIVKELSSYKNTFCNYELGMENKYRIVCATDLNPEINKREWEKWWSILPYRINKAVNK